MEQMKKRCLLETALFGWGSNTYGQLAHFKMHSTNTPMKIHLPEEFTLDEKSFDINSV